MKKIVAVLAALCLICSVFTALAEENAFTVRKGVKFTMSMDEVMAAESGRYEIDKEHTKGGVTFDELEYENVTENGARADVKYYFIENKLVAVRVDYDDKSAGYDQIRAAMTEKYGESGALDAGRLGSGIYAVDDDGRPEGSVEAWTVGSVMIVLEHDRDDIDVTYIDLDAEYIAMK